VAWRKSDDPAYESVIAQHVASKSTTQASGDYVGAAPPEALAYYERLARLVEQHFDFWGKLAGTGSGQGAEWWLHRWMPFYNAWRSQLVSVVKTAANELIALRHEAARLGLPTPPLGTSPIEVAVQQGARLEGDYVGADIVIGAAIDDVRRRAQMLADKRAGTVIGVIHTSKDGLWHTLAFRAADDADDWLGTATHDPASFTYAAYYDKEDFQWPHPVNEKIGGERTPSRPGEPIRRGIATSGDRWA
jgi:hypothetical protein